MKLPKVSVIIPVYNVDQYLSKCITSVINQEFDDVEIILVDDGSTDSSSKICDEFSSKYENITTIHKNNGGLSDARNVGVKQAMGEYITFIDSDDWLYPGALQYLVMLIEKYNADFVMAKNSRVKSANLSTENISLWTRKEFLERFFKLNTQVNVQYAWAKLYRKELIKDIKFPVGLISEDVPFTFQVALISNKIVYSSKVIYHYFYNSSSITTKKFSEQRLDLLRVWDLVVKYAEKSKNKWIIENALLNRYRADFGILINLLQANRSLKYKKIFLIEHINILSNLHSHYKFLLKSPIPASRKALISAFPLFYKIFMMSLKLSKWKR